MVAPNHRVRTERTAFRPTPGGLVELMGVDRPIYLGAGPLRRGCSRQFYPQGADIKAGRQADLAPWGLASRLMRPGRRLPPFATYVEPYVGQEKG